MIVVGLTGSIGMGKSVCAAMLERIGVPVHDADKTVHELLSKEGPALKAVRSAFPYYEFTRIYGRKNKHGLRSIKRAALGKIVFEDAKKRKVLEGILHPLVRKSQDAFIRKYKDFDIVALDIPLLFETGADTYVDVTLVADAPYTVQRARVLDRPGMTEEKFHAILERQMPNRDKCARADYVVKTGLGRAQTMKELKAIITKLRKT